MAPLGTDIVLFHRDLASSDRYGHRGCKSSYSTCSYPDEDRHTSYTPPSFTYRERDRARTYREPRRRERRLCQSTVKTRRVTSPPSAVRDYQQEHQYRKPAEPRSPRPANPEFHYSHDDSSASGWVSPASSQEDFMRQDTHQREDRFLCLLCRENGKALYRITDRRNTTETQGLPYFVFYDRQEHRILPPNTDRGPPEERATDGHVYDGHFNVLSKVALDHGWNKEAPTPRKMDYTSMFSPKCQVRSLERVSVAVFRQNSSALL
jgi:hypothetical protein